MSDQKNFSKPAAQPANGNSVLGWIIIAVGFAGSYLLLATFTWSMFRLNVSQLRLDLDIARGEIGTLKTQLKVLQDQRAKQDAVVYAINQKYAAIVTRGSWFTDRILEADEVWYEALQQAMDRKRGTN